jgi:hypothetical protein
MNFIKQNILYPEFEYTNLSDHPFLTFSNYPEQTKLPEFKVCVKCSELL